MPGQRWFAERERPLLLLLLSLAILIRLALVWYYGLFKDVPVNEAYKVAVSFAEHGTIADSFFAGQGPTAHLLPIPAFIAGTIYRLFGVGTPAAGLTLLGSALCQVCVGYLLVYHLFKEAGMPPAQRLLAFAGICLYPTFARNEIEEFRFWEGALTLCFAAWSLLLIVRFDRRRSLNSGQIGTLGIVMALCFFISPTAGLAVYACFACLLLRRRRWEVLALTGMASVMLALFLVPWTIRNYHAFGQPVVTRSNFGLELALGNYDGALAPGKRRTKFVNRLRAIHPNASPKAAARVKEIGEVRYSEEVGRTARAYLISHPGDAVILTGQHLLQFLAPTSDVFSRRENRHLRIVSSIEVALTSLLGIAGLIYAGLIKRQRAAFLIVVYVAIATLPYTLVFPVSRYTYIVFFFLFFPAVQLVLAAAGRLAPKLLPAADVRA